MTQNDVLVAFSNWRLH